MNEPRPVVDLLDWEPLPDAPVPRWARKVPPRCAFVAAGLRRSPRGQLAYICSYRAPDGMLTSRVVIKPAAI